jgi:ferredoxin
VGVHCFMVPSCVVRSLPWTRLKEISILRRHLECDMDINSVKLVYFSPTGTSKRVAEAIAKGIQVSSEHIDLTPPTARSQEFERFRDELAVIAAPVYAGRIPSEAVYRLRRLSADDTPAVLVAVYGNRLYEDALVELRDLAVELGFRPVAGGAFIGEHSYSTAEVPTAHGRPDADDVEKAVEFGRKIMEKMSGIGGPRDIPPLEVPGDRPYREGMRAISEPVEPVTREELCVKCGRCADVCPTSSITVSDVVTTKADACIWCCACVKSCPSGARVMSPRLQQASRWLNTNYSERREPETYL